MASVSDSRMFNADLESVPEFVQRFKLQNHEALHKARNDDRKKAVLLANSLPVHVLTNVQRRLLPTQLEDVEYDDLLSHLLASYEVKKSLVGSTVTFFARKQKVDESVENYAKSLNELASRCSFDSCCRERILRDIFITGLSSHSLMGKLVTESEMKPFYAVVERAKILDQIDSDLADIANPHSSVQYKVDQVSSSENNKGRFTRKKPSSTYVCIRCGRKGDHFAHECFALGKTCNKCHKKGHLKAVCRSTEHTTSKHISHGLSDDESVAEGFPEYPVVNSLRSADPHSVCKHSIVNVVSKYLPVCKEPLIVTCYVNNTSIEFELDSGSHISTINENDLGKLGKIVLKPTTQKAKGYSNNVINFQGEFIANITCNVSLLGRDLCEKLGIMFLFPGDESVNVHSVQYSVLSKFSDYLSDNFVSCVRDVVCFKISQDETAIFARLAQFLFVLESRSKLNYTVLNVMA